MQALRQPQVVTGRAQPFLKWVGGKRKLIPSFEPLFPPTIAGYFEPFMGGATVFFHLRERLVDVPIVLGDINQDLVYAYQVLQRWPAIVISQLRRFQQRHSAEFYYAERAETPTGSIARAVRFLYLNRACFNGLWRENRKGQMNAPMGDTPKERLFDFTKLELAHVALQGVRLYQGSFDSIDPVEPGWFVYIDSPYDASWVGYSKDGFTTEDQARLAACCQRWHERGAYVMVSNNDTPLVRSLFAGDPWNLTLVTAARTVSRDANGRGPVTELVIRNYRNEGEPT